MQRRTFMQALMGVPGALFAAKAKTAQAGNSSSAVFEWLPSECAHERWPMQMITGEFDCGMGRIVKIPTGKIVNNGLGEIASTRVVGERLKPVPERLSLSWFSFAEDRFYGGEVAIPTAMLIDLFRTEFIDPRDNLPASWHRIIVGMGLGGWVHVWIAGATFVREIATARLPPVEGEWRRVIDNPDLPRTDFIRSVLKRRTGEAALAELDKQGAPVEDWPRYFRKVPWTLHPDGPNAPIGMTLRHCNGERSYRDLSGTSPQATSAAPKLMQITWRNPNGKRLLTEIRFNEDEIYAAFDKTPAPPKLHVDYPGKMNVSLWIESGRARIPLTKPDVKVNSLS